MQVIHIRKNLKPFRKYLRNNSTAAEASFWTILKNKQVGGLKFRRQHSVGKYVLDFYCPEIKLCIELDGDPHSYPAIMAKDNERDSYLNTLSITVFRYENKWVFEAPEDIIADILEYKAKFNSDIQLF